MAKKYFTSPSGKVEWTDMVGQCGIASTPSVIDTRVSLFDLYAPRKGGYRWDCFFGGIVLAFYDQYLLPGDFGYCLGYGSYPLAHEFDDYDLVIAMSAQILTLVWCFRDLHQESLPPSATRSEDVRPICFALSFTSPQISASH